MQMRLTDWKPCQQTDLTYNTSLSDEPLKGSRRWGRWVSYLWKLLILWTRSSCAQNYFSANSCNKPVFVFKAWFTYLGYFLGCPKHNEFLREADEGLSSRHQGTKRSSREAVKLVMENQASLEPSEKVTAALRIN